MVKKHQLFIEFFDKKLKKQGIFNENLIESLINPLLIRMLDLENMGIIYVSNVVL